jgi:tripartite-type tricarboxylate transporter receptor subunit TctC
MKLRRMLPVMLSIAIATLAGFAYRATAQTYPNRPVRIVVGFAPGGSTDLAARIIGQWLTDKLGRQFVVENRPGTVSNIAAETVARAAPDGHTLLVLSSADTINPTLHQKTNFDLLRDIAPVAGFTQQPQVLMANPSLPVKSFEELIAYVKADPGKVTIASAGNGAISHLAGELLKMSAGIDLIHLPYRGSGPALTDLLAGHVNISFSGMAGSTQYLKSNRLRALAVTTVKRSATLPDVPTVGEFYPGYSAVSLFGIGAPKNTPSEIVGLLNKEINAALADPAIETRFADLGGIPLTGSPADFTRLLTDETDKWRKVITTAKIKVE